MIHGEGLLKKKEGLGRESAKKDSKREKMWRLSASRNNILKTETLKK